MRRRPHLSGNNTATAKSPATNTPTTKTATGTPTASTTASAADTTSFAAAGRRAEVQPDGWADSRRRVRRGAASSGHHQRSRR